ncbi:hypothetical protein QGN29_10940 [Temperatibacter marinus]|uniref:Uncharacterized protein n=1 Tax=Temperatibacter marinus TaxID=1456591 RepID=A0AA52H9Y2_9PROT|nr:hypothetical protein [Temperatibacter marinus]WND02063.1 hypothetical protein QGN29_10940 [Temperatibacter marinus]
MSKQKKSAADMSVSTHQALVTATEALLKIDQHEKICSTRWGLLTRLLLITVFKLGALLFFLLSDKLGWI